MKTGAFLVALMALAAYTQERAGSAKSATTARLAVFNRVPLSRQVNGIDGELQLLQDARLTASLIKKLWGTGDVSTDVSGSPGAALDSPPLLNAKFRIVKPDGMPISSQRLERPLARMDQTHLYGDARDTYLVTVDYSAGFGSYSGPITFLLEVAAGRLNWLEATEGTMGKNERISLMRSLKSVWQIVAAPDGARKEILEALCRPALPPNDGEFRLIYRRYFFDGKKWLRVVRERAGFAEFEEELPDRSLFP